MLLEARAVRSVLPWQRTEFCRILADSATARLPAARRPRCRRDGGAAGTGPTYEIPVVDGAIRAIDQGQIKVSEDDFGLLSYDPASQNTASCRGAITYIDGDRGSCCDRNQGHEDRDDHARDKLTRRCLALPSEQACPGVRLQLARLQSERTSARPQVKGSRLDSPLHRLQLSTTGRQVGSWA